MPPSEFITRLLSVGPPGAPSCTEEDVRAVEFHGLEGLAVARDRESEAGFLPGGIREAWEPIYRARGFVTALTVESGRRAQALLKGRGMESVLFKGAALVADRTYADPGARRMDDADVVVAPEAAAAAVTALKEGGFEPVVPWSPDRVDWVDALTFHDSQAPSGVSTAVDLHWRTRYDTLRFGGNGRSVLLQDRTDSGASLAAGPGGHGGLPAPEPHLVIIAEHALKHLRFRIHLAAFGDAARVAAQVEDWGRVEELVQKSRLEAGLRAFLAVTAEELEAPVPPQLFAGAAAGLRRELSLEALVVHRRAAEGRLGGILHRWRLLGSPGKILGDMAEAAFPSGAWLRARYGRGGVRAWARYVADVGRWAVYRGRSPASPHQELFDPRARE